MAYPHQHSNYHQQYQHPTGRQDPIGQDEEEIYDGAWPDDEFDDDPDAIYENHDNEAPVDPSYQEDFYDTPDADVRNEVMTSYHQHQSPPGPPAPSRNLKPTKAPLPSRSLPPVPQNHSAPPTSGRPGALGASHNEDSEAQAFSVQDRIKMMQTGNQNTSQHGSSINQSQPFSQNQSYPVATHNMQPHIQNNQQHAFNTSYKHQYQQQVSYEVLPEEVAQRIRPKSEDSDEDGLEDYEVHPNEIKSQTNTMPGQRQAKPIPGHDFLNRLNTLSLKNTQPNPVVPAQPPNKPRAAQSNPRQFPRQPTGIIQQQFPAPEQVRSHNNNRSFSGDYPQDKSQFFPRGSPQRGGSFNEDYPDEGQFFKNQNPPQTQPRPKVHSRQSFERMPLPSTPVSNVVMPPPKPSNIGPRVSAAGHFSNPSQNSTVRSNGFQARPQQAAPTKPQISLPRFQNSSNRPSVPAKSGYPKGQAPSRVSPFAGSVRMAGQQVAQRQVPTIPTEAAKEIEEDEEGDYVVPNQPVGQTVSDRRNQFNSRQSTDPTPSSTNQPPVGRKPNTQFKQASIERGQPQSNVSAVDDDFPPPPEDISRVAPAGQDSVPPPLPKNAQVPHVPRINTTRGPVPQSTVGQRTYPPPASTPDRPDGNPLSKRLSTSGGMEPMISLENLKSVNLNRTLHTEKNSPATNPARQIPPSLPTAKKPAAPAPASAAPSAPVLPSKPGSQKYPQYVPPTHGGGSINKPVPPPAIKPVVAPQSDSTPQRPTIPDLNTCTWYKGDMNRNRAAELLNAQSVEGSFIVRNSTQGDGYSISIWSLGKVANIKISLDTNVSPNLYSLGGDGRQFKTVQELVTHFIHTETKLTSGAEVKLVIVNFE